MELIAPRRVSEEMQLKRGGKEGRSLGHHRPLPLLHPAPPLTLQRPAASCRAPGWAGRSWAASTQAKDLPLCISWLWDVVGEISRGVRAQAHGGEKPAACNTGSYTGWKPPCRFNTALSLKHWSMGTREMSLQQSKACNCKCF